MDQPAARQLVSQFVDAFHTAAATRRLDAFRSVATPDAQAAFLVESHSGTVVPLASETAVPAGARVDVDLDRVLLVTDQYAPEGPPRIVVPFAGHGFAREDFSGDLILKLRDGQVERARFHAP